MRQLCFALCFALALNCQSSFAQTQVSEQRVKIVATFSILADFVRQIGGDRVEVIDLVGPARAKDILFSARRFKGQEALAMGLVNRVIAADQLEAETKAYGAMLADNAPLSILASKVVIDELCKDPADRDMDLCAKVATTCADSDDFKEGRKAFMEKRKPVWRGK